MNHNIRTFPSITNRKKERAELTGKLELAIDRVLQAFPNVGASGWWANPSEHVEACEADRACMRSADFLAEVLASSLCLAAGALQTIGHGASACTVDAIAGEITRKMGINARPGAVICAAHWMGAPLAVASDIDASDQRFSDCAVHVASLRRSAEAFAAGNAKEAA